MQNARSGPYQSQERPKHSTSSVENMTGGLAVSSDTKSMSRGEGAGNGVGILLRMGDPVSDMTEETDHCFVRVGVRTGRVGGPLVLEVHSKEDGVWHYTFAAFFDNSSWLAVTCFCKFER